MTNLTVIELQGKRVLTTAQLAESYGTDNRRISENFNRHEERYKEGKHFICLVGSDLKEFGERYANSVSVNRVSKLYLWTEKGAWRHAKSLNTDQAWDAYEALVDDYYVKNEYINKPQQETLKPTEAFEMGLIGNKYMMDALKVDDNSKIRMIAEVYKMHGVPTLLLPTHTVSEKRECSMTELLKTKDYGMSAISANKKLMEIGILEELERPSSTGSIKTFKSLTNKGLYYGINTKSVHNSKETQPLYKPSKFEELMNLISPSSK